MGNSANLMDWRWVEQLTRLFELCQVTSSETAVVLADAGADSQLREVCALALQRLTPEVVSLLVADAGAGQQGSDALAIPSVRAALAEADFVADCSRAKITSSHLLSDVLGDGTRILTLGGMGSAGLASGGAGSGSLTSWELFAPHPGVKARVEAGLALLDGAASLAVRTDAAESGAAESGAAESGAAESETDETHSDELTIPLRKVSHKSFAVAQGSWGFCDQPASVAHWPSGTIYIDTSDSASASGGASATNVAGSLALSPGDLNLTLGAHIRTPTVLQFEAGQVVDVAGEGEDASVIQAQLHALLSGNPRGSILKSFGWGMLLPARLPRLPKPNSLHSLVWPEDFPASREVANLAGVCFVCVGGNFDGVGTTDGLVLALRSASVSAQGSERSSDSSDPTDIICAGELQADLAPDIYEIASRG